jgi:hypothetical protein
MYYYPIVPFMGRASGATRHLKRPPAGFIGRGGFTLPPEHLTLFSFPGFCPAKDRDLA